MESSKDRENKPKRRNKIISISSKSSLRMKLVNLIGNTNEVSVCKR